MQPGTAMCFLNFYTLFFWTPLMLAHPPISLRISAAFDINIWSYNVRDDSQNHFKINETISDKFCLHIIPLSLLHYLSLGRYLTSKSLLILQKSSFHCSLPFDGLVCFQPARLGSQLCVASLISFVVCERTKHTFPEFFSKQLD